MPSKKKKEREFSKSMPSSALSGRGMKSLNDFFGSTPNLNTDFSDMMLDGTASRLNTYGLSEAQIASLEVDPDNPYKTHYVTINPDDASYASQSVYTEKELPELKADDADWLFTGKSKGSLEDKVNEMKLSDRLQERLKKKGLLEEDDDEELLGPGSPKREGSPKKLRVALRPSPRRGRSAASVVTLGTFNGSDSLTSIDLESSPKKKGKKKIRMKKSAMAKARKEFFDLIALNPKKKKDRANYDDKKVFELLDKNPWLAKEKLEVDFCKEEGQKSLVYPLSIFCSLGASKDTVVRCISACKAAITDVDNGMGTPLHYACMFHAELQLIKTLYRQSSETLLAVDDEKRTPLHVAAWSEMDAETVAYLVKKCPEALKQGDEHGNTPLHLACREGADLDLIKELAPSKRPEICLSKTRSGATPLHLALFHELPFSVINYLVSTNEAALKVADAKGKLPLHVALAAETPKKVIVMLLTKYGAAKGVKTKNGKSPYTIAKKNDFPKEILKLLS